MFPHVVHTKAELTATIAAFRDAGEKVALVPTMGALHAGHIALVQLAGERADRVVVSIFVNPTQFAPHEDFDRYPRVLGADAVELANARVDIVYAPPVEEMYPEGFSTRVVPEGGPAAGLESDARPHFFGGVATVVTKLFTQVKPDLAVFGEKDWQQLQVVTRLARDLDLGVEIVPGPTVREADGLALSSRNRFLSVEHRAAAPALYRVLSASADSIAQGQPAEEVLKTARAGLEDAGFTVDYVEVRNARTLKPVQDPKSEPLRLLVAARIGGTRLIDNVPVIPDN